MSAPDQRFMPMNFSRVQLVFTDKAHKESNDAVD